MMDPEGIGGGGFILTDPIVFGGVYSGTSGVEPLNNAPEVVDDLTAADPGVATNIDVLANDSDADGDPLTIIACSDPATGSTAIDTKGTADVDDDEITYTANPRFSDTDSFTYTIDDGNGGGATGTVNPVTSATLTLTALVNASGDCTNTAAITGLDVAEPDATNNQASVSIFPETPPADVKSTPIMTPMGILVLSALLTLLGAIALHRRNS